MIEDLLTIDEVCTLLRVKRSYIYRLTSRNEIPYYKISGLKFKRSDIEAWVERNRVAVHRRKTFEDLVGHTKSI